MVGLQLHHREAQRGVLHCFEEVVGLAMPEVPGGNANPRSQQFMPTVEQVGGGGGGVPASVERQRIGGGREGVLRFVSRFSIV